VGFVRWTEQRNFEAVLDMMADGRLNVAPLVSHRFEIDAVEHAYRLIGTAEPSLGILLQYPQSTTAQRLKTIALPHSLTTRNSVSIKNSGLGVSFIGAGNYATAQLIPAFKRAGAKLLSVVSDAGMSGVYAGRKFDFESATTDTDSILKDVNTQAVVITTRHDSHAELTLKALKAGKHVFVEKPLCLTKSELSSIESVSADLLSTSTGAPLLMVGFNRRFAPHITKIKELLSTVSGPKAFVMTVNAGAIPAEHWAQDSQIGGGRLLGEACHFIDLLLFLAESSIEQWHCTQMNAATLDTFSIDLKFVNGSIGTIHYFANGNKAFAKERLDVFVAGRTLHLDNFRKLTGYGWPKFKSMHLWRQDKGQRACAQAFIDALAQGKCPPIPHSELFEVSRVALDLAQAQ
jgi:predicted dehydrogenase